MQPGLQQIIPPLDEEDVGQIHLQGQLNPIGHGGQISSQGGLQIIPLEDVLDVEEEMQAASPGKNPPLREQPGPANVPIRPNLEPQIAVPVLHVGIPLAQDILPLASQVGLFPLPNVGVKF